MMSPEFISSGRWLPAVAVCLFWLGVISPGLAVSTEERAAGILIPHLEVDEVPVQDVFTLLRKRSRDYDPDHHGVNFVFKFSPAGRRIFKQRTLTLSLNRMALSDVIRYTCMASGLKYRFEENAVLIYDSSQAPEAMRTRVYNVAPGVLDSRRTRKRAEKIDSGIGDDDDDDDH